MHRLVHEIHQFKREMWTTHYAHQPHMIAHYEKHFGVVPDTKVYARSKSKGRSKAPSKPRQKRRSRRTRSKGRIIMEEEAEPEQNSEPEWLKYINIPDNRPTLTDEQASEILGTDVGVVDFWEYVKNSNENDDWIIYLKEFLNNYGGKLTKLLDYEALKVVKKQYKEARVHVCAPVVEFLQNPSPATLKEFIQIKCIRAAIQASSLRRIKEEPSLLKRYALQSKEYALQLIEWLRNNTGNFGASLINRLVGAYNFVSGKFKHVFLILLFGTSFGFNAWGEQTIPFVGDVLDKMLHYSSLLVQARQYNKAVAKCTKPGVMEKVINKCLLKNGIEKTQTFDTVYPKNEFLTILATQFANTTFNYFGWDILQFAAILSSAIQILYKINMSYKTVLYGAVTVQALNMVTSFLRSDEWSGLKKIGNVLSEIPKNVSKYVSVISAALSMVGNIGDIASIFTRSCLYIVHPALYYGVLAYNDWDAYTMAQLVIHVVSLANQVFDRYKVLAKIGSEKITLYDLSFFVSVSAAYVGNVSLVHALSILHLRTVYSSAVIDSLTNWYTSVEDEKAKKELERKTEELVKEVSKRYNVNQESLKTVSTDKLEFMANPKKSDDGYDDFRDIFPSLPPQVQKQFFGKKILIVKWLSVNYVMIDNDKKFRFEIYELANKIDELNTVSVDKVFRNIRNLPREEPPSDLPKRQNGRKRSKTPKRESPVPKNIRDAFQGTKGVFLATWKEILPGWVYQKLTDVTNRAVSRLKNLKLRL